MKLKFSIMSLILLLGVSILSFSQDYSTAEVNNAGTSEEGTILVKSVGYGNIKSTAVEEAQVKAFRTLLFKGIPGSSQAQALIENESQSISENKSFYDDFFDGGRYKNFLMESSPITSLQRKGGKKQMIVRIKINVGALRKDLEQKNIIRKFGL